MELLKKATAALRAVVVRTRKALDALARVEAERTASAALVQAAEREAGLALVDGGNADALAAKAEKAARAARVAVLALEELRARLAGDAVELRAAREELTSQLSRAIESAHSGLLAAARVALEPIRAKCDALHALDPMHSTGFAAGATSTAIANLHAPVEAAGAPPTDAEMKSLREAQRALAEAQQLLDAIDDLKRAQRVLQEQR